MDAHLDLDDARITRLLEQLRRVGDGPLRPAFQDIGANLKASTRLRFRDQRGPNGSPWHRVRRGGQALRLTGRLANSISYRASERSVEVGTNVVYAKAHQFGIDDPAQAVKGHVRLVRQVFGRDLRFPVYGTVRPFTRRMHIWARPFLGFSDDDRQDILDVLREHLDRLAHLGV